jgi:c-di-GMP-binding flagellar brake protein YcgR
MNPRRTIPPEVATGIFEEAVREHALAVLSVRTGQSWCVFKSRFLECDPARAYFVLDYQPLDNEPLPELVPGQCVGVSFRHRNRKVLFDTVVEARGHYLLDDRLSIPAVRYRFPTVVTELQRRAYYRTPIPETMSLLATVWPGGITARNRVQKSALEILSGTLINISCGGALIRLNGSQSPDWSEEELLGAEIHLGDGRPPVQVDARSRGLRKDEFGSACLAIQFLGLELSVEGRMALQRLASTVQRLHRMALASGRGDWANRHPSE